MDRKTIEVGPEWPELLEFTADETALCVRAVTYSLISTLGGLGANWDEQSLRAVGWSPERAVQELDVVAETVDFHRNLVRKFSKAMEAAGEPIELTSPEIMAVGEALYVLGSQGTQHAKDALNYDGGHSVAAQRIGAEGKIGQTAAESFALFKKLEPIALGKANRSWFRWTADSLAQTL